MILNEDGLMNYALHKFAKSLYITKKIGYYYIKNTHSISKNILKDRERHIKDCFLYLKFIFEYTKNNQYEKNMANCIFRYVELQISDIEIFKYLKKDYSFYNNIISIYLSNEFISPRIKNKLRNIFKNIRIGQNNKS
jgi:hypothetical protein